MNQEQILSILYEMAMVMSAETHVEPLLHKTLQKLMYHTGFPCGAFISAFHALDSETQDDDCVSVTVQAVIGNHRLKKRIGDTLCLPSEFVIGKAELIENNPRIQSICDETDHYLYLLKLPVGEQNAFLLFSPNPPRNNLPFTQLFEPLLKNFAKTLQLCQINESYTARLVEEREHAYSDLRRFRAALDTSDDCIFIIDPVQMKFIDFNQSSINALGYSAEQLLGMGPQDVMDELNLPRWRSIVNRALNDKKEITEIVTSHKHRDGKKNPVEVRLSAFKKNRQPLIIAVSRDITIRKKAEDELKAYKEHLQELVAERTRELQASNRELESYSYSIAHDLRAPLRSIVGFSQIILEDAGDKLDDTEMRYINKTIDAGKRMGQLIDEILELARLSRVSVSTKKVDLSMLAFEIIETLKAGDPERYVNVIVDRGLEVKADPQLIRLCMENLIGNAWKYTRRKPQANISIGLCGANKPFTFYIRDNGAGFDMQYNDKLFLPFHRLHNDSEFEGTGIGLATVQRIIERHGGKIWAESKVGEGATFYFTLQKAESSGGLRNPVSLSR